MYDCVRLTKSCRLNRPLDLSHLKFRIHCEVLERKSLFTEAKCSRHGRRHSPCYDWYDFYSSVLFLSLPLTDMITAKKAECLFKFLYFPTYRRHFVRPSRKSVPHKFAATSDRILESSFVTFGWLFLEFWLSVQILSIQWSFTGVFSVIIHSFLWSDNFPGV